MASIFGELSHRKNISETKLPLAGPFFFRGNINASGGSIKDVSYYGGLMLHVRLGCANKDLWGPCAPISTIVVYSKTATSYYFGAKE